MSRLSEFSVPNPEYEALQRNVNNCEREISQLEVALYEARSEYKIFKYTLEKLSKPLESLYTLDTERLEGLDDLGIEPNVLEATIGTTQDRIRGIFDETRESILRAERYLRTAVERHETKIKANIRELAQLRAQLDKIPEDKRKGLHFNLREARKQLNAVEGVVRNSIRFGVDHRGKHYIRWTVSGLMMKPSYNPWFWINSGSQDVQVPLQDMYVTVYPYNNKVSVNNLPGETDLCPFNWNGPAPHPHILSTDGETCLGDFGGYITEAIANQDFNVVGTLVNLFLSQAATEDSAGAHWKGYFSALAVRQGFHVQRNNRNQFELTKDKVIYLMMCVPDANAEGGWRFVSVNYDLREADEFYNSVCYHRGNLPADFEFPRVDWPLEDKQEPAPEPRRIEPFRSNYMYPPDLANLDTDTDN